MSRIDLFGGDMSVLKFREGDEEVTRIAEFEDPTIGVSIDLLDDWNMPSLIFTVDSINKNADGDAFRTLFTVAGYESIDLLRRYFEMTLELFRDGRLE